MMYRYFVICLIILLITACNKYQSICDCVDSLPPTSMTLLYPNNFPTPTIPDSNPLTEEGVNLGRHLFYDPILSSDNTVSCASCHKQEHSFGDNISFSVGVNSSQGERHSPTIVNAAFQEVFDWDGKSSSLEDQAVRPIFNEIELHNNNWSEVINRLKMSNLYPSLFCAAFGTEDIDSLHILLESK